MAVETKRGKERMTVMIDLTPADEAQLNAIATQQGWNRAEAAYRVLTTNLSLMATPAITAGDRAHAAELVEEYHALLGEEDAGGLSVLQAARLRQVEAELNRLEDQYPIEQAADRRLQESGDKLDEILALLRSLPKSGGGE